MEKAIAAEENRRLRNKAVGLTKDLMSIQEAVINTLQNSPEVKYMVKKYKEKLLSSKKPEEMLIHYLRIADACDIDDGADVYEYISLYNSITEPQDSMIIRSAVVATIELYARKDGLIRDLKNAKNVAEKKILHDSLNFVHQEIRKSTEMVMKLRQSELKRKNQFGAECPECGYESLSVKELFSN